MIKSQELTEDLLSQIKSMNSDDMIADLLMNSQKNHQSYPVNQKKYKKFDFTYYKIFQITPSQIDGNWLFHTLNKFGIWRTIFSRRHKK